mgnify:CR=1 FL=1|jgi:acetyltransferase-like isoleucine patch superfamily enzyme
MKYNQIKSKEVSIGVGCQIHESLEIHENAKVTIGDHCYLGPGIKILSGNFTLGDYSKIHDRVNINPKRHVNLGHLSWIGQGSILDGTGGLVAGNYLGVGINSCLYSHIRHGDIGEGCKYDLDKELTIEDDVWFVGMCLVSPVHVESKSVAFLGSTIVKKMEYNKVYAGNPAKDITNKVGEPWSSISVENKHLTMIKHIDDYSLINKNFDKEMIVVVGDDSEIKNDNRVYYNVSKRTFTKKNHKSEIEFNKWLFPYKFKFSPV